MSSVLLGPETLNCLSHRVGDATQRAYARGDMLEKRFNMLNIWADYLISKNESN